MQAHYLLGVMAQLAGQRRAALAHLERVTALDPTVDDAWLRLGELYRELNDRVQLERVRLEVKTRFGRSLP